MYINQASDRAYSYIVEQIRSGIWKPGDKIATESQLVEQIGVSRVAIRQAIERLVTMSVLNKVQGSGTYVERQENMSLMSASIFGFDLDFMLKILEFRRMFDSYNVELFVEYATDGEIAALQKNYAKMVASKDNNEEFYKLDQVFHDMIANGTRNPLITQISGIFMDVFISNQKSMYSNVGPENAIFYHGKMLEAIQERNGEVASIYARKAMETSIRRLKAKKEKEMEQNGQRGACKGDL